MSTGPTGTGTGGAACPWRPSLQGSHQGAVRGLLPVRLSAAVTALVSTALPVRCASYWAAGFTAPVPGPRPPTSPSTLGGGWECRIEGIEGDRKRRNQERRQTREETDRQKDGKPEERQRDPNTQTGSRLERAKAGGRVKVGRGRRGKRQEDITVAPRSLGAWEGPVCAGGIQRALAHLSSQ